MKDISNALNAKVKSLARTFLKIMKENLSIENALKRLSSVDFVNWTLKMHSFQPWEETGMRIALDAKNAMFSYTVLLVKQMVILCVILVNKEEQPKLIMVNKKEKK